MRKLHLKTGNSPAAIQASIDAGAHRPVSACAAKTGKDCGAIG
jgi:hypothetical protein